MSEKKYRHLIDEVCSACSIDDPKSMYDTCNLMVGDVPITLAHAGPMNEDNLLCFCDFGEPPEENFASSLVHVLEANMFLLGYQSPHFAINPETGHILLIAQILLEDLSSDELLRRLNMYASAANQWRDTHSLNSRNGDMAPAPLPNASMVPM